MREQSLVFLVSVSLRPSPFFLVTIYFSDYSASSWQSSSTHILNIPSYSLSRSYSRKPVSTCAASLQSLLKQPHNIYLYILRGFQRCHIAFRGAQCMSRSQTVSPIQADSLKPCCFHSPTKAVFWTAKKLRRRGFKTRALRCWQDARWIAVLACLLNTLFFFFSSKRSFIPCAYTGI